MLREKTTHSFIVKDEERNNLKHKWWNVESSLAQRDASSAEESARLDSSRNHTFFQSNACIYKHAQWKLWDNEIFLCETA